MTSLSVLPRMTTQTNMPGASGIRATNWGYNKAPRDGSVMLATYQSLIDENLLGNRKVKFDIKKFSWIGSIGTPSEYASAFAYEAPTRRQPTRPGRFVTAMASTSAGAFPASSSAFSTIGTMRRMCALDACSGTTPPNSA